MVKDHSNSEKPTAATTRITARNPLYAPPYRQDNTYHGLCYNRCGALVGTRYISMCIKLGVVMLMGSRAYLQRKFFGLTLKKKQKLYILAQLWSIRIHFNAFPQDKHHNCITKCTMQIILRRLVQTYSEY